MTKLDAKMDQDTVYRLLASPQWTTQSSLLPTDPQFIAATHQTLADSLFCPCPEPPPDLDDEDDEDIDEDEDNAWDEDIDEDDDWAGDDLPPTSFLKTQNPELETPETPPLETRNLELETLALLQKVFPSLVHSQLESRETAENQPKHQREKSAKLPRKTSPQNKIKQLNQKDKQHQKNTRKNPGVGRQSASPPANQPLETRNSEPGTQNSELETPHHESLFDRLRRKWATTPNASNYSCDSEKFYEEYLKEKEAAGLPDTPPADPEPETATPPLETRNSELETPQPGPPKTREPLNPVTHPKEYFFAIEHGYRIEDTPKHIPDRRWEEDFGNPRRFKGSY
jgi:hypothetical protein